MHSSLTGQPSPSASRPTTNLSINLNKTAWRSQKIWSSRRDRKLRAVHMMARSRLGPVRALRTEEQFTWKDLGKEKLHVFEVDSELGPYEDHMNYRFNLYQKKREGIEKFEGGLKNFALGYKKYGINHEDGCIVYREWAPAAVIGQLVGDFNNWNGWGHQMEKDQYGVWTIRIPNQNGRPAIEHGSRVKFRMQKGDGEWLDRIPAWIRYATVEPGKMGASYDGIFWNPSQEQRYQFQHPSPPPPVSPRIYEAHVGMSGQHPGIASYSDFADHVLPRIKANNYNTVQLMAVMEHSYYASFGYHVTNFFAVSSRSGTPEQLKYLIDKAHSMGLRVLMDLVHSHASNNVEDGLNGYDLGQQTSDSYFHTGDRGYHKLWDSRLFNYGNWEVLRFLLSNLRWWMEEYRFDGFRFDGVTSMLYHHHGIHMSFSGKYWEYLSEKTDVDAVVYLMLANDLIHMMNPTATTIAEDVSGMPTLGRAVPEGGVGFDYRLAMGIPDKWIKMMKEVPDEGWPVTDIAHTLLNRRYTEKCVAYAESHDQSLVGDKSFAFQLMDKEMYFSMSALQPANPIIDRGIALHKMIHFLTMALGGDGYLNFMGNEFGHPEWLDFPREGNNWSYDKCRRQWDLADTDHLRFKFMNAFDSAMNALEEKYHFLTIPVVLSCTHDDHKIVVFDRGPLVFIFNFHPKDSYESYKIGCDLPGKYRIALDSDAFDFGGHGRVPHDWDHFTSPEGVPGNPETNFNNRPCSMKVPSPSRTCQVYHKVPEDIPPSVASQPQSITLLETTLP